MLIMYIIVLVFLFLYKQRNLGHNRHTIYAFSFGLSALIRYYIVLQLYLQYKFELVTM